MARNYIDPEIQEYLAQDLGLNVKVDPLDDPKGDFGAGDNSTVLNSKPISFRTTDGRECVLYENGAVEVINE